MSRRTRRIVQAASAGQGQLIEASDLLGLLSSALVTSSTPCFTGSEEVPTSFPAGVSGSSMVGIVDSL